MIILKLRLGFESSSCGKSSRG